MDSTVNIFFVFFYILNSVIIFKILITHRFYNDLDFCIRKHYVKKKCKHNSANRRKQEVRLTIYLKPGKTKVFYKILFNGPLKEKKMKFREFFV